MTAKKAPVKRDDVPVFLKKVSDKIDGMYAAGTTTISIVPNQRQRHRRTAPDAAPMLLRSPHVYTVGASGGLGIDGAVRIRPRRQIFAARPRSHLLCYNIYVTMIAIYSPPLLALVISPLSSLCRLFT